MQKKDFFSYLCKMKLHLMIETMSKKIKLNKNLDHISFQNHYFLKEELVHFCRLENLQTSGGKADLSKRIEHYLKTGEKLFCKQKSKKISPIENITKETLIEENFVCSEKHRAFFKQKIGKNFSFNVPFQNWLKTNSGKSY